MRLPKEDNEVTQKLKEFGEAVADEIKAASIAASLSDELLDLGIDVSKIRDWK